MSLVLRGSFTRMKETSGDRKFVFTPPPAPTAPPIPILNPIKDPGVEITIQSISGSSPFTVGSDADLQWVNIRDVQAEPNAWAMVKVRVFNSGDTALQVNLKQILFGASSGLDAASVLGTGLTPVVALDGVTSIEVPDDAQTLTLTGVPTDYLSGDTTAVATDILNALYNEASTRPAGVQLSLSVGVQDQFVLVFFLDYTGLLDVQPDLVTLINTTLPGGAMAMLQADEPLPNDVYSDNESFTGTPVAFVDNPATLNSFAGVSNTDYVNTGPSVPGDAIFTFDLTSVTPSRQRYRLRLFQVAPAPVYPYTWVNCWGTNLTSMGTYWVGTDYTGENDTRTEYSYSNGSSQTYPQPGTVDFLNALSAALFTEKGYLDFELGYQDYIAFVLATDTPFIDVSGDHLWRLQLTTWTPDDGKIITVDFDSRQQ